MRRVACTLLALMLVGPFAVAHAQDTARGPITLRGGGATFPAPLYERWIQAYRRHQHGVAITYDPVGSSEGQRRFIAGAVEFGASDAALTDEQMSRVKAGARLVPVTAGIVVLAYNLPGLGGTLKLGRDVVADILAGEIRTWDDPRIRAANPGLALPHRTIAIIARQDGSGTTFALTNHLSAVNVAWRDRGPGVGNLVDWRGRAMLARGNEGVAGRIKVSEGSIGYVEFHFAKKLGLTMAQLQNAAGRFVEPSEASGQAALARNLDRIPENLRLFIPDPAGDDAYPIVTLSWLLVYERYPQPAAGQALRQFLTWCLGEGQTFSRELGYIPLPDGLVTLARAAVDRIQ